MSTKRVKVTPRLLPGEHKQTHSVIKGKLRYPGYLDGTDIRSIVTGEVLASRDRRGWSAVVQAVNTDKPWQDTVTPDLTSKPWTRGTTWDGIPQGRYF